MEVVEVKDKAGFIIKLRRLDGILYPDYALFDNAEHKFDNLKHFQFRPDDVITIGQPRTGNHWSFEIVHMLLHQSNSYNSNVLSQRMITMMSDEQVAQLDQEPSPRQFQSHLRMSQFPDDLPVVKPKIIYLLRNPKAVFWSLYNLATALKVGMAYTGTLNNFLELLLSGNYIYGSWFDHVLACEQYMESHPELPVHVLCYEQMKLNPAQEIQRLADYLGQPLDQSLLAEIVDKVQFSTMKKELYKMGKMATVEGDNIKEGREGFIRKGELGDWKNGFSKSDSEAVDKVFEEKMSTSRLGALVKPFMEF